MLKLTSYTPERIDGKDTEWRFLFSTKVRENVFTYLTTNIRGRTSIEEWKNNFSTFFDIENPDETPLGTIGFSIAGISIFDPGLQNRRDFSLKRNDDLYLWIEKLERKMCAEQKLPSDDMNFVASIWEKYIQPWDQDGLN